MIDVSQIKSIKELQEMMDSLNFFINKKFIARLYEEKGESKETLDEDRRLARELLQQVIAKLTQLGVNQPTKKKGSKFHPKGTKGKSSATQPAEECGCGPCKE